MHISAKPSVEDSPDMDDEGLVDAEPGLPTNGPIPEDPNSEHENSPLEQDKENVAGPVELEPEPDEAPMPMPSPDLPPPPESPALAVLSLCSAP